MQVRDLMTRAVVAAWREAACKTMLPEVPRG